MAATYVVSKPSFPQEVLFEIFEWLDPGSVDPDARPRERVERRRRQRALARLARTCQVFTDPALNVLWRVVDDLVTTLSLLPGFKFASTEHHYVGVPVSLCSY